ncbi:MAG: enoyl-CoA hydratase/isomerase family protein [Planctomycetes bacterium]|nr:enoyl-CoA hydratase/isomerase family protein [Planctomycetota bacterium]
MSDALLSRRIDHTLELTLNRPSARNALSRDLIASLTAALNQAEGDPNVRSIIITGTPPAFCAGLDLREVAQTTATQAEHDASSLLNLFERIDLLGKPVIAAVNGPAVAGGAGLVSVCDIVVCGQSGVIGYPEIKRGLVAAIVMTYLRRLVGERQAKWLLLTGENLPAERALEMRLCNEVVSDEELLPRARHYAAMFASYPPQALTSTKQLWNRIRSLQHADAVEEARQLNASMRLTSESRQGIGEFLKG